MASVDHYQGSVRSKPLAGLLLLLSLALLVNIAAAVSGPGEEASTGTTTCSIMPSAHTPRRSPHLPPPSTLVPVITKVWPNEGSVAGGTRITISGSGFSTSA